MRKKKDKTLILGYEIYADTFWENAAKKYTRTTPEVSHYEDRYCQRTGKKLAPYKIVDKWPTTVWFLGDKEFRNKDPYGNDHYGARERRSEWLRAYIDHINFTYRPFVIEAEEEDNDPYSDGPSHFIYFGYGCHLDKSKYRWGAREKEPVIPIETQFLEVAKMARQLRFELIDNKIVEARDLEDEPELFTLDD